MALKDGPAPRLTPSQVRRNSHARRRNIAGPKVEHVPHAGPLTGPQRREISRVQTERRARGRQINVPAPSRRVALVLQQGPRNRRDVVIANRYLRSANRVEHTNRNILLDKIQGAYAKAFGKEPSRHQARLLATDPRFRKTYTQLEVERAQQSAIAKRGLLGDIVATATTPFTKIKLPSFSIPTGTAGRPSVKAGGGEVGVTPADIALLGLGGPVTSMVGRGALRAGLRVGARLGARGAISRNPLLARELQRSLAKQAARGPARRITSGAVKLSLAGTLAAEAPAAAKHGDVGQFRKALTGEGAAARGLARLGGPQEKTDPLNVGLNFLKDAINLPANIIPMVYLPAEAIGQALISGDSRRLDQLVEDFKNSDALALLVQGRFREAARAAAIHPLWTGLEVAGVGAGATGRFGLGGLAHATGARRYGLDGARGPNLVGTPQYTSRNLIASSAQLRRDARLKRLQAEALARPGGRAERIVNKAFSKQQLKLEDFRAAKRSERRATNVERALITMDEVVRAGGRDLGPVVGMAIERTARPGTFVADLQAMKAHYERNRASLDERGRRTQDDQIASIDAALEHPEAAWEAARSAADTYLATQRHVEQRLIDKGLLDPRRAQRARLIPELFAHRGARFRDRPTTRREANELVSDAVSLRRDAQSELRKATNAVKIARANLHKARGSAPRISTRKGEKVIGAPVAGAKGMARAARKRNERVAKAQAKLDEAIQERAGARAGVIQSKSVLKQARKDAGRMVSRVETPATTELTPLAQQARRMEAAPEGESYGVVGDPLAQEPRGAPGITDHSSRDSLRLVLRDGEGEPIGVLEGVLFNETEVVAPGMYIAPHARRQGHASALAKSAEKRGYTLTQDKPGLGSLTTEGRALARALAQERRVVHSRDPELIREQEAVLDDMADDVPALTVPEDFGPPAYTETGAGYLSHVGPREAVVTPSNTLTPGISSKARTGQSTVSGGVSTGYEQQARTLMKRANLEVEADLARDFTREQGIGGFDSREAARSAADTPEVRLRHGGRSVIVRLDPTQPLARTLDEFDSNVNDGRGMSIEEILEVQNPEQALREAFNAEGPGQWTAVSERAFERFLQHRERPDYNNIDKAFQAWKQAILPTSPHWVTGNFLDINLRAFLELMGVPGTRKLSPAFRSGKRLQAALGEEGAGVVPGGFFGAGDEGAGPIALRRKGTRLIDRATDSQVDALMAPTSALQRFARSPTVKNLTSAYGYLSRAIFTANRLYVETPPQIQKLGRVHREHLKNVLRDQEKAIKLGEVGYEEFARGLVNTPTQLAYAEQLHRTFGNWNTISPRTRRALVHYAPFLLWAKAACRFVYMTMPAKHPVKTGLAAAAGQMTDVERKILGLDMFYVDPSHARAPVAGNLMGGIPSGRESAHGERAITPVSTITSFGVFANGPLGLAGFLVPPLQNVIFAGKGLTWYGGELKHEDGSALDPIESLLYAAGTTFEPFIPFVPLARRLTPWRLPGEPKSLQRGPIELLPFGRRASAEKVEQGRYYSEWPIGTKNPPKSPASITKKRKKAGGKNKKSGFSGGAGGGSSSSGSNF